MSDKLKLGDTLDRLFATIESRQGSDPKGSYTADLLNSGHERCAKKFGEEAVEAAIAGAIKDREGLAQEAADALYHLLVLMASCDVSPSDVASILTARAGTSGHDEKATRKKP